MRYLLFLVVGSALALLMPSWSAAQSPYLNPALSVRPAVPTPGSPFDLVIRDTTGVVPTVLDSGLTVGDGVVDISASIQLGYIDFSGFYELISTVPSLPSGIHTVRYFARTKRPDTELTDYFLIKTWRVIVVAASESVAAVEFFNAPRNHYFLTTDADEIDALDAKIFPGWERTGEQFKVLQSTSLPSSTFPVCRFYGKPEANLDTHFYSGTTSECELLLEHPDQWILERLVAFRVGQVNFADGACPANMIRVFRLWNGSSVVNHRYTTSLLLQQQMQALGWIAEGSGAPPAVWCALP